MHECRLGAAGADHSKRPELKYQIAKGHDRAREALFRAAAANPQNLNYQGNLELRFAVPAAASAWVTGARTKLY